MDIVVQKFGGTSVATKDKRKHIIRKVKAAIANGDFPIVVVSAMGRTGDPYSTDTLLNLLSNTSDKRTQDMLISCGEVISSCILSNELCVEGVNATPLNGGQAGIVTNSKHSEADILNVDTLYIDNLIKEAIIPVVAGFQGVSKDNEITTIGRGGSDVTAAILGVALNAKRVEIYTDVDGILTGDPNIVPDASLIKSISFEESFQFAFEGAKVIHPRAVEIAMKNNLTLLIKNTTSDSQGTIINNDSNSRDKIITGITSKANRIQIKVDYVGTESYYSIFTKLGDENISLDLINVFPKQKIFTIDACEEVKFKNIMSQLQLTYEINYNCCKISLIGSGMRGTPGVMARILTALSRERIEVLQTADSHNTIWCLVQDADSEKAIKALHNEFSLGNE